MGGRFFLFLAGVAFAALLASLIWAGAIVLGHAAYGSLWQFPAFALPFLIMMLAVHPRDEGERLLSGSRLGLHPSNRRAALASCFAPYRYRHWGVKDVGKGPNGRMTAAGLALAAVCLASGIIIPLACYGAALCALRRAAWFGNADAILMEWDWLRIRGPVRTADGRRLAARARAR